MSLTEFINRPEVSDRMKPFRPDLPREIPAPLLVEPRTKNFRLVGTAFDYLIRFELQRRAPHAKTRPWIAETSLRYLVVLSLPRGKRRMVRFDNREGVDPIYYLPLDEVRKRAGAVVDNAKDAVAAYLQNEKTSKRTQLTELAAHAIRLAKLDQVFRARRLPENFEDAETEDVEDLLDMLGIVPFDSLLCGDSLFLNPDFGESSRFVGGADADLIPGDLLVDFKVTKKCEMTGKDLDQLLGYYLLARHQRVLDPEFPEIKRVALYFCRHGFLWVHDVDIWTRQSEFPEFETWFFSSSSSSKEGVPGNAVVWNSELGAYTPETQAVWDSEMGGYISR